MTSFTRIFSSIKSAYQNINPSTLTGAIDVIVVKQEDGSLRCTPFHVRFGKLGVLQNQQNKVYITINGKSVDLFMELGEAGEALFIEEESSPTIPPTRHLEPSDSNVFLDPDSALSPDSDIQLSNIDCSPQIVNKQLDIEKSQANHEPVPKYAYEQLVLPSVDVDVLNSNISVNTRRHGPKRSSIHKPPSKQSSEDDDHEIENIFHPKKHQSRPRHRDSTPISLNENLPSQIDSEHNKSSETSGPKRSVSENDLSFFPIDDDKHSESSTPFVDAHSRMNSIDSRRKLLIIPPQLTIDSDADEEEQDSYNSSLEEEDEFPEKNTRTLSNPIPIEQKGKKNEDDDDEDEKQQPSTLINAIFSQSAPSTNVRISQSNETNNHLLNASFSPTSAFQHPIDLRPSSPKSDTEYELDKPSQQLTSKSRFSPAWQWKWGELPEQRRSVFRYFWPSSSSSKQSTPKEGIYLDDITNNKCDDRSRYLPQLDFQQKSINDDDQESGTGNSIPHSPVRDQENAFFLGDIQLSLCRNLNRQPPITDEQFNAYLISYDTFVQNPKIVHDPNLVVRIGGKYYNWDVASAVIASTSIFHKQLPVETIEQLQDKHVTPTKSRTTSSSWWPFSARKADETNDIARSEALAQVAKSEVVETILRNQSIIRNNSNDSDSNENDERHQQANKIKQSSTNSTRKRTLLLTSDQLKRLNLKSGCNHIEFSVTTALQGTTPVEANIFYFDHMTKFVISDIDGTITKSDVFGHILPLVGKDWSHDGIATFFQAIQENGYQFIYLSARAIGQSQITRNFLKNIKQCDCPLPSGPLLISPDTLVTALYREVIAKKPEDFKIECLKNIASLFPGKNPFYAGFGNRINDQWAYIAVGIPVTRIFTINPRGEVVRQKLSQVLSTSYRNLHEVVDQVFPPMDSFSASETYSSFTFWRDEPVTDPFEEEMRVHLEEITERQRPKPKGKGTGSAATGALPKTTPTTTVIKPGGEKLLTIAQATENTVKKA